MMNLFDELKWFEFDMMFECMFGCFVFDVLVVFGVLVVCVLVWFVLQVFEFGLVFVFDYVVCVVFVDVIGCVLFGVLNYLQFEVCFCVVQVSFLNFYFDYVLCIEWYIWQLVLLKFVMVVMIGDGVLEMVGNFVEVVVVMMCEFNEFGVVDMMVGMFV